MANHSNLCAIESNKIPQVIFVSHYRLKKDMRILMLLYSDSSEKNVWKPRRKTINPAFHARNLDAYVPIMSRRLENFARKLDDINGSASGYFNIMPPVRAATFGVLMGEMLFPIFFNNIFWQEYVASSFLQKIFTNNIAYRHLSYFDFHLLKSKASNPNSSL